MYNQFYGFSDKPFSATPDSKFFFPSAKHLEALNSMRYAIEGRKGFVVITGEIGAGKTTVCRTVLNLLDNKTKVGLITNTHLTPQELMETILDEFEVEYKEGSKQKLLSQFNDFLIRQLADDMNVVLIIDEAQNLSSRVMEEVRMLSNLETEREKLIQIILLGQPELKKKLQDENLVQFKQRISIYFHLSPLTQQETQEYIKHRLSLAFEKDREEEIFTPEAVKAIYEYSKGIPRLINLTCDSALLSGYVQNTKKITGSIINEVIKERDFANFISG
jgi:general secretion pathway protein A